MKFKIEKSEFINGLQAVQNVVGSNSTLPILSNVLLRANKNELQLITTDLDVAVLCKLEAEVEKTGSTTIPVRRLFNIVRELPGTEIEIEVNDKDVSKIISGSSKFTLNGLSEDEFPPIPKVESKFSHTMKQILFKEMLSMVQYAASDDETRPALNGVYLSFKEEKFSMVATDGRRLALIEQEVELPSDTNINMILPTKAVNELHHTLGGGEEDEVKINATDKQIFFEFGNVLVSSKLIDGTYPNYEQVMPDNNDTRITIERESMLFALKRASLLSVDSSSAVKLTFADNRITVLMSNPEVGEAKETIPVKYDGKELSIAFNPDFMIEPLKNISEDEVYLELMDEMSPGVLKCSLPFVYVLMPVRIS
jgi:DNA polymerase-3 subunit beta